MMLHVDVRNSLNCYVKVCNLFNTVVHPPPPKKLICVFMLSTHCYCLVKVTCEHDAYMYVYIFEGSLGLQCTLLTSDVNCEKVTIKCVLNPANSLSKGFCNKHSIM